MSLIFDWYIQFPKEKICDTIKTKTSLYCLVSYEYIFSELNWTTRLMYKQRFSQYVLPMLMERYHEIKTDTAKAAIMKALSYTIQVIPKQMLQSYFDKVFKIVNCILGDIF